MYLAWGCSKVVTTKSRELTEQSHDFACAAVRPYLITSYQLVALAVDRAGGYRGNRTESRPATTHGAFSEH
jgi:hypothetical protein